MPTQDTNPPSEKFLDIIKELYQFYKKNLLKENKKKFFRTNALMASSAVLCGICSPLAYKWFINGLTTAITKHVVSADLLLALGAHKLVNGIDSIIDTGIDNSWESFNYSTRRPLALKKTKQAANIPEEAQKKPAVEAAQTANQNAEHATRILNTTSQMAFQLPYAVSSAVLASTLNPAIGATIIATCAVNGYLTHRNAKSNKKPNEEFRQINNRYNSRQVDVVQHYSRVKNLGREEEELKDLKLRSEEGQKVLDKKNNRILLNRAIQIALTTCANIGIGIWAALEGIHSGDMGTTIAIMSATSAAMFATRRLTNCWGQIREEFDSWRHTEKDLQYDKSHDLSYGDKTPSQVRGLIEIKNASYTYPAEPPKPALSHINLSIGHGMTVITGPSGSGKSTLLKLLQHTREGEGQILLDGVPLTELPKGFLETQTSIVNQRPDFFSHRTLRENLMSVQDHLTDSEIKKALAKTALLDELSADEYEKKNMNQLSGGQQQRENIAESFLQDKPIIIYDEPTANLDEENKRRIWHHLQRVSKNKTVIIVTHDIREIESADRVIYLKEGQIIQDGTPEELQNKKGPVRDLLTESKRPLKLSPEVIQQQEQQRRMNQLLGGLKTHKKRFIRKRLKQAMESQKVKTERE